jgi:hypothetical protein
MQDVKTRGGICSYLGVSVNDNVVLVGPQQAKYYVVTERFGD